MEKPFEIIYFDVLCKALGLALVAEHSGLPWKGSADVGFVAEPDEPTFRFAKWLALKPQMTFGQLPLLTTADGEKINQTIAICNHIGKKAGTEGVGRDYDVSQMLLAEGEELFNLMDLMLPTAIGLGMHFNQNGKLGRADYDRFWETLLPLHLQHLEKLCAAGHGFNKTPGSWHIWSILHQLMLVNPLCLASAKGGALESWYIKTLQEEKVQKVLKNEGGTGMGKLKTYYVTAEVNNAEAH